MSIGWPMNDITELNVTQVRIYAPDKLPFFELNIAANLEAIKTKFAFRFMQQEPPGNEIVFSGGILRDQEGVTIIHRLSIDPRRITLQVKGGSSNADSVQGALWETLESFVASKSLSDNPLTKSEETACVATLAVDVGHFMPANLHKYLDAKGRDLFANKNAKVRAIELNTLSLTIKYEPTDSTLIDRAIALPAKQLVLQPRFGTLSEEKRFFTSSPTGSETHFALLEGIEQALSKSKSV
jgi:hypothetical protein